VSLLEKSVFPILVLTIVGSFAVGVFSPAADYLLYLPVVLGGVTVLTLVVQLGLKRKEGFVDRVTASVVGSMVIVALATAILAPMSYAALALAN